MGKAFDYVKHQVVNFKLNLCCFCAPVRIGLLIAGYLNIILALASLLALCDDSFSPILIQVQDAIMGDDAAKKPMPLIAYSAELSFSAILLCAIYRKDIPLLRLYQRYCIVAVIASVMVYSMVVAAVGIFIGLALIVSIVVQMYIIILVRSLIVEIKLEKKKLELPTLVMCSTIPETKEFKVVSDVEAPSDSESDEEKSEISDKKDRLETVDEHPKEESTSEEEGKGKK